MRQPEREGGKEQGSAEGTAKLCGCCVILMAGGLAVEMKEHIPVVFSDLWSYKYPVCGQLRSSSIHDLLPTEPGQEKEHVNTCWSGWLRGLCV